MTTKRTPRNRPPRESYTPQMVEIFRQMQQLEPDCHWQTPDDPVCAEWMDLHGMLFKLLRCKAWEFWCIQPPHMAVENEWDALARQRYIDLAALAANSPASKETTP
jgi:hypothetical protein